MSKAIVNKDILNDLPTSSGASLVGGGDQVVASVTALRALLKTSASKNAIVTGYYVAGDGGGGAYWYDSTDTTTADNGGTVIVATDGGRWKLVNQLALAVHQFGAKCDGITDDTTAIQAAINAATDRTITISGTPLISSTITVANKIRIEFQGASGLAGGGQLPSSYLIKKASMTTTGLVINSSGTVIVSGGVIGEVGNTGNGIDIFANYVTLVHTMAYRAGNDGVRIGVDTVGVNVNGIKLDRVVSSFNGRHGIYISDASINANACVLTLPFCQSNGGDGIRLGIARVNTIIGPLTENNTGIGLHFANGAQDNQVFGGDIFEGNVAGNLNLDAGSLGNMLYGLPRYAFGGIQNAGTRNVIEGYESPAFTPALTFGGGSTGITYSLATGHYTITGNSIVVYITLILTSKGSSVGAAQITGLPFPMAGITFNSGVAFSQYTLMAGLTGALVGQVSNVTSNIALYQSSAVGTIGITDANFTASSNIQLTAVYPF